MRYLSTRHGLALTSILAIVLAGAAPALADGRPLVGETPAQHDSRMAWWREARFGMFIHWGLYAIPAGVYKDRTDHAEWFLETTQMPVSEYEKYAAKFNPMKFDARQWVAIARKAGMKYIVITSKHHDGFGLFPSALTDWCVKSTPFGRDPLKELAAACKEGGIRFCTYHSIMDWHHPDWGVRRAWNDRATGVPDMNRFTDYLKGQVTEIVESYHPAVMWFDGQWEKPWTDDRARAMYRYLQGLDPELIINNRVGGGLGDFGTPEQTIPATGLGPGVDWESCMTLNDHWGYNSHDKNWKSVTTIIHNLVDCASKGGNYLLNVGPTAEGIIPPESVERLAKVGAWMKHNGDSIYGTTASPFKSLPWGRCTRKGSRLYLHVFNRPGDGVLHVPMAGTVSGARLLADSATPLPFTCGSDGLRISLPATLADPDDTVITSDVQGDVEQIATVFRQAPGGTLQLLAQDADVAGGVQIEGNPPNLGYWTNVDGIASWPILIDHPSQFTVTIEYALDPGSPGSEYVLSLGDRSLSHKLAVTHGWQDYTRVQAGTLAVEKGRTVLSIKPAKKPAIGLMNLRSVTLAPAGQ
jgi:alpha-L-fucosidase